MTSAEFGEAQAPMPGQATVAEEGGSLQIGIDVEAREGDASVRSWAATMKRMQPTAKVETVPGVGVDAIYMGHASQPRQVVSGLRRAG